MAHQASSARSTRPPGSARNLEGPQSTLSPGDTVIESTFGERLALPGGSMSRWMGWRLRLLVAAALIGCLGLFLITRYMAGLPRIDATWRPTMQGQIELVRSSDPVLSPYAGQVLVSAQADGRSIELKDALTLQRSARWVIDDELRARHRLLHEELDSVLTQPTVRLVFADGRSVLVQPGPRGFGGLPALYWLLCGLALLLYLVATVVLMAKPNGRNLLYAVLSLSQAGNLVFIAIESTLDLALPCCIIPRQKTSF